MKSHMKKQEKVSQMALNIDGKIKINLYYIIYILYIYYIKQMNRAVSRFKAPITCSGPQYVDYARNWIEKEINDENLFPTTQGK